MSWGNEKDWFDEVIQQALPAKPPADMEQKVMARISRTRKTSGHRVLKSGVLTVMMASMFFLGIITHDLLSGGAEVTSIQSPYYVGSGAYMFQRFES